MAIGTAVNLGKKDQETFAATRSLYIFAAKLWWKGQYVLCRAAVSVKPTHSRCDSRLGVVCEPEADACLNVGRGLGEFSGGGDAYCG